MALGIENHVVAPEAQARQPDSPAYSARLPNDSVYSSPIGSQAAIDAMKGAGSAGAGKADTNGLVLVDNGRVVAGAAAPAKAEGPEVTKSGASSASPAGGNWLESLAGKESGVISSTLSDFGSTSAKTWSDMAHGTASVSEMGLAVEEAGAIATIGGGAVVAAGLSAGVDLPAAAAVLLGGALVTVSVGAMQRIYTLNTEQ